MNKTHVSIFVFANCVKYQVALPIVTHCNVNNDEPQLSVLAYIKRALHFKGASTLFCIGEVGRVSGH